MTSPSTAGFGLTATPMDCSLATWPSITQFDDFSWTKLGDIDSLDNLDRMLDQDGQLNVDAWEERRPSSRSRWESLNSFDFGSFLDSTFPPINDPSTSNASDGFNLCRAVDIVTCGDQQVCDVNVSMSDPISELSEVNIVTLESDEDSQSASLVTGSSSLSENNGNDAKLAGHDGSTLISGSRMDGAEVSNGSAEGGQSLNSFQFIPGTIPGANTCNPSKSALDAKDTVLPVQYNYTAFGPTIPWHQPHLSSIAIGGGKAVHHHFPVQLAGPTVLDRQLDLVDAVRVRSELKCSRAEASRARRRAASQRRAKKYPLQKLIRMSSSPSNARDKIDHDLGWSVGLMMQPQKPPMESQTHLPSNSQKGLIMPVVLQGPQLPLSQKVQLCTNSTQEGPFVGCQQQVSMAPDEDSRLSSGSSAMQSMCSEESLEIEPPLPSSHTTTNTAGASSMQPLDGALLEQLHSVLSEMSVEVRLSIRDALYRLARNARQRQSTTEVASGSDGSSCQLEDMETPTNTIDRWIVDILFCKQPTMEASEISSLSLQQRNSCGSFSNLQERPLHAVRGL